ncbi:MAG: addiction module protein [Candidatus Omnitrophica bacterium]|nr:addiction module protein [Candidatus Omnitrophota bacterium]MCA9441623.1 addiction module protein [Candidatus Omnitrophota bacterium]MCB9782009.1 addiction module protein [Candidatus Omnitrophota bacterium]
MNALVEKLVSEALSLSPQARAFVAEKLIESLDTERGEDLSPAWREEVRKRCAEMDEGSVELRDAEEVFARAQASLK